MKNEDEKMQEFMKDFTNAHGELPKSKWIDPTFNFAKKLLKVTIVIGIITIILMLIPLSIQVYDKAISNVMSLDKEGFIKKIEKTYGQKIEMIQDESTYKGNGKMVFRTTKEPIIEFTTGKNVFDDYILDYEDKALLYYAEKDSEGLFKGLTIEQGTKSLRYSQFYTVEVLECKGYLSIEGYDQIEEGVRQLIGIRKFMTQKLKQFKIPLHLKIGDYISWCDYSEKLSEEEIILREKQLYYWDLQYNGKDTSFIPEEDLAKIDRPQTLEVLLNGEKVIDKEQTQINKNIAAMNNEKDYETAYFTATYQLEEEYYHMNFYNFIFSCDKFQIVEKNYDGLFGSPQVKFSYQNKTYEFHWRDYKVHGKRLPAEGNIEFLTQVLGIQIEYDYRNKKVNLIIP